MYEGSAANHWLIYYAACSRLNNTRPGSNKFAAGLGYDPRSGPVWLARLSHLYTQTHRRVTSQRGGGGQGFRIAQYCIIAFLTFLLGQTFAYGVYAVQLTPTYICARVLLQTARIFPKWVGQGPRPHGVSKHSQNCRHISSLCSTRLSKRQS